MITSPPNGSKDLVYKAFKFSGRKKEQNKHFILRKDVACILRIQHKLKMRETEPRHENPIPVQSLARQSKKS